jgi:hypothetical protein
MLASRLKHLRENKEQKEFLSKYDVHHFFDVETREYESIGDFLNDDDLGMLAVEDDSIFDIKNVPNVSSDRSDPDFVANRKTCMDFNKFEPLFIECQDDLKTGKRKLTAFVESEMKEGDFFVLSGVLIYLDKVDAPYRGNSNKINRRTRCIYENGTESNALLRSLGKRLSEVGYSVTSKNELSPISETDQEAGYIYILRSLSTDPRISTTKNLFKIGFSTTSVEQRIQNADQDPTYLMAAVSIVTTFQCFNMNPQRLERLLHRFLGESCLSIEITDKNGNKYTPKEWFIAPIEVIEVIINLIISGEIVNYTYDKENERVVRMSKN